MRLEKPTIPEKKTIVYIIGAGRSGTTLLDILLGNGAEYTSLGEINRFPKRDGIPPKTSTASDKYYFWLQIRDIVMAQNNQVKLSYIHTLHKKFEYHTGYLFNILLKKFKKHEYRIYTKFLTNLYDEIFKYTKENTIIESSKYPGRACNLSEILPYEMKYIYLQRDPVAVVNAFMKKNIEQPSKSWLLANIYYFFVNLLCKRTIRKLGKKHNVITIKYEDLLAHPVRVLTDIEKKLSMDLSLVKEKLEKKEALKVGYLFDGNRIRTNDVISFQPSRYDYEKTFKNKITRYINLSLYS
ncbi:MAG: sulfotransferase [Sporocytophaga sp.]|uniref:sulfotransferase n=1 Tax=Sporocytophaga sp. TaxID=2231183 RepID=UPI001B24406F|nr:sulfotransferase [Sporocytophaga sp.]MBO9699282.1 sulfotransferase [Sporocytophaga sp.]